MVLIVIAYLIVFIALGGFNLKSMKSLKWLFIKNIRSLIQNGHEILQYSYHKEIYYMVIVCANQYMVQWKDQWNKMDEHTLTFSCILLANVKSLTFFENYLKNAYYKMI